MVHVPLSKFSQQVDGHNGVVTGFHVARVVILRPTRQGHRHDGVPILLMLSDNQDG